MTPTVSDFDEFGTVVLVIDAAREVDCSEQKPFEAVFLPIKEELTYELCSCTGLCQQVKEEITIEEHPAAPGTQGPVTGSVATATLPAVAPGSAPSSVAHVPCRRPGRLSESQANHGRTFVTLRRSGRDSHSTCKLSPGAVNMQRSYQICQAAIRKSRNQDQLRCRLKPLSSLLTAGSNDDLPRGTGLLSEEPECVLSPHTTAQSRYGRVTSSQDLPVSVAVLPTAQVRAAPEVTLRRSGRDSHSTCKLSPGAVNMQRSYQICQAAIRKSRNQDQLRCRLKPLSSLLTAGSNDDLPRGTGLLSEEPECVLSPHTTAQSQYGRVTSSQDLPVSVAVLPTAQVRGAPEPTDGDVCMKQESSELSFMLIIKEELDKLPADGDVCVKQEPITEELNELCSCTGLCQQVKEEITIEEHPAAPAWSSPAVVLPYPACVIHASYLLAAKNASICEKASPANNTNSLIIICKT
ncbi:uncharacterized protein LOC134536598 isoform X2 [Bacillus rossius redtenbacheri]|uniref:uncharacterized protein LOC134536598 isoform X2 n=1 Tax=Bacillus rossius redtenbacheri TaxID=93214 RepID=UPI002FDCD40E